MSAPKDYINQESTKTPPPAVCAVVVTYNRKALLIEALRAICDQTIPPAVVLVIDNASTDGTKEALVAAGFIDRSGVEYVRLPRNGGGAAGFREGISRGAKYPWIWVMDDDTVPAPDALEHLFAAWNEFPAHKRPVLLSSRVNWTDGSLHPTNVPSVRRMGLDPETAMLAAQCQTVPVRLATFVSLLIDSSVVAKHGLPFSDYFIWNDDTEYTARILREGFGVIVPRSQVVHKTGKKQGMMDAAPGRYYFQVRNVIWMIARSDAWLPLERVKIVVRLVQWTARYLSINRWSFPALIAVGKGLRDGIFTAPKT